MAIPDNLLATVQADLEQLIEERTLEGPYLDFKRDLPAAWNDGAKHELLADVTAFANAGGGHLVFGIDEDGNSQAAAIAPLILQNADQEVRRLQDILLNQVEPRLPGIQVHTVPVDVAGKTGYVLIVRVPQSWHGPHRVKTNQHFFIRDGARKRQLDVPEIRSLFLRSENQAQRVRDFRAERLSSILSGQLPHRLVDGPTLVMHLIPMRAIQGLIQIDPVLYAGERMLPLIGSTAALPRLNVDGALVIRNPTPQGETYGYSQLFRNGFFESTYVLSGRHERGLAVLPSKGIEQNLIDHLSKFRQELTFLNAGGDCIAMLSLLRANEVKLGVRDQWHLEDHQTFFDRKTIVLPDIVARDGLASELALKPLFDLLWQAAGFTSSQNYDSAGQRLID
jgi:hypothetical protein